MCTAKNELFLVEDDIIVGNFKDAFHNLTYKDSMLVTWVKHECPAALYIFKGDDDTLVNPFELDNLILTVCSNEILEKIGAIPKSFTKK